MGQGYVEQLRTFALPRVTNTPTLLLEILRGQATQLQDIYIFLFLIFIIELYTK